MITGGNVDYQMSGRAEATGCGGLGVIHLMARWWLGLLREIDERLDLLKAHLVPERARGLELLRMEFRRFLHAVMLVPCQVARTARRIVWRVLGYNHQYVRILFEKAQVAENLKI